MKKVMAVIFLIVFLSPFSGDQLLDTPFIMEDMVTHESLLDTTDHVNVPRESVVSEQGQTVKVSYSYPKALIERYFDTGRESATNYVTKWWWEANFAAGEVDGSDLIIWAESETESVTIYTQWDFYIDVSDLPLGGTLYLYNLDNYTEVMTSVDVDIKIFYNNMSYSTWSLTGATLNESLVIDSTITVNGRIYGTLYFTGVTSATDSTHYFGCGIDAFYYSLDDTVSHIRSTVTTEDCNNLLTLTVPSYSYYSTITVSAPDDFDYIGINPYASTSWSGNDLQIENTVPLTYTLKFVRNNSRFLAINDVSNDYFSPGFESGYSEFTASGFAATALNSTVVYSGAFSLRLSDADASTETLSMTSSTVSGFSAGYYYVSFAYYVESFSGTSMRFGYADDNYETLTTGTTVRWQQAFYYTYIDTLATFIYRFDFNSAQGVLFIDDFRVWTSSIEAYTNSAGTNTLKPTVINLDGYSNNPAAYKSINVTYGTRADNTTIQSWNRTTDANGQVTITATDTLTAAEHFARVRAYDNTFSGDSGSQKTYFTPIKGGYLDYFESEYDDAFDFSEGDVESFTGLNSMAAVTGSFSGIIPAGSSKNLYSPAGPSIDTSYYTQFQIRYKGNDSTVFFQVYGYSPSTSAFSYTKHYFDSDYQTITLDLSASSTWNNNNPFSRFRLIFNEDDGTLEGNESIWIDYIRIVHIDTPNLREYDSYFYLSSENDTLSYKIYQDESYAGIYNDLAFIQKNLTANSVSHNLTYVVFQDNDEQKVYLPSSSYYYAYTVSAAAFTVSAESFTLSDDYCNLYATANYDYSYTIYENDTSVGSGSGTAEGTAISHARETDYATLVNLAYKFTYSSETVWFNTSYSNADYTKLKVVISTPILVDGRISLAVTSNLGDAEVNIDDDSKAGTEVDWESEGVFSWYSNVVGTNNITIQVRRDCNSDGDTSDTGETWSDSVQYHLYDEDLSVVYAYLHTFTDEGATFVFMSNYRGSATTEFRCRIQDSVAFSGWLSEDDYNGTYDFTFTTCDLDTTYNFSVEIRAYITDESPGYQYKYLRFEYTPYSPDAYVSNPQGIARTTTTETTTTNDAMISASMTKTDLILIAVIAVFAVIGIWAYMKRDVITTTAKEAPGKITDYGLKKADEFAVDLEKRMTKNQKRK